MKKAIDHFRDYVGTHKFYALGDIVYDELVGVEQKKHKFFSTNETIVTIELQFRFQDSIVLKFQEEDFNAITDVKFDDECNLFVRINGFNIKEFPHIRYGETYYGY